MKEALLVIDVQNDYFPGGANELYKAREAEDRIIELIDESRKLERPVIYMQHFNSEGDSFFIEGTEGIEISQRIAPLPQDKVIAKRYPSSFLETELDEYLKNLGIEKLIVCGMMTHMCVDTTVRAAQDHGYAVDLVMDACATKDLEIDGEIMPAETVQKVFMASLAGVFANIV